SAYAAAWRFIADRARSGKPARETEVQAVIMDHFARNGLVTDHPPIVGVGPHAGDPHYAPGPKDDSPCAKGCFVLIDLWAKLDRPRSVYSDLTRTGFVGETVPEEYETIFQIVARPRDAAIDRVRSAFGQKQPLQGWQVDRAARDVIEQA